MGAPILSPSQAEQDFTQAFARFRDKHAEENRATAFANFTKAGLPSRRVESWHYTDLRARLRQAPPLAVAPDEGSISLARRQREKLGASDTLKLVTVDGFFAPDLSDDFNGVAGVEIRPLASLRDGEPAAQILRVLAAQADDPLADLNAAFYGDGLLIEIADGARIEKPIELMALGGDTPARSRFSRHLVLLGAGARAGILETRAEGEEGFGDSALLLSLGKAAELDYACRCEASAAIELQNFVARLGAEAQLRATALIAGSPFLRRQIFVVCAGENAQLHLAGAALLKGREQADTTLVVTHEAPACFSRQTYKYVLAEQANGVFQGKIVVPAQAQKTDGKMLCRSLLLSDDASMSAKPELEIFADDVACGHGAACAKLDANQLFYMESRGVPKPEAQAILIEAFAAEAFDILNDETLRNLLRADLAQLLAGGEFA
jgi:Fe-S cluster assembly protein SufD